MESKLGAPETSRYNIPEMFDEFQGGPKLGPPDA